MRLGMRQRVVRDKRRDVAQLGRFRFQEFPPRGHAVENIRDADRRPRRNARRLHADQLAARELDARSLLFFRRARFEKQPRNRGDRRQRLAAKSERRDRKQVVRGAQLRRRVALERQQRVVMVHSAAVVNHADHALAARFDFDANRARARVQRVFEQLLHHRRGPLDHLARRDLVRDILRKYAYSLMIAPVRRCLVLLLI